MLKTMPNPLSGGQGATVEMLLAPIPPDITWISRFAIRSIRLAMHLRSAAIRPDVACITAAKLWQRYPALSDAQPLQLRIIDGGSYLDSARQRLPPCGEGHLFSIVHGENDFAMADLSTGFAFASLSRETLSDRGRFTYYFLEPLVYAMLGARYFVFVHASCISRNGRAILLCGDSGSGKTCLAYACARLGWDYVAGDALHVVRGHDNRTVIGRPYEIRFRESARRLFPELDPLPVRQCARTEKPIWKSTQRNWAFRLLCAVRPGISFSLNRPTSRCWKNTPRSRPFRRLKKLFAMAAIRRVWSNEKPLSRFAGTAGLAAFLFRTRPGRARFTPLAG